MRREEFKIKEIRSQEVQAEAIRLCMEHKEITKEKTFEYDLMEAFVWMDSPQEHEFWHNLFDGIISNTVDLKLPTK